MFFSKKAIPLQCVFHGIRLLRLTRIDCRETINFFCIYTTHLLFLTNLHSLPSSLPTLFFYYATYFNILTHFFSKETALLTAFVCFLQIKVVYV